VGTRVPLPFDLMVSNVPVPAGERTLLGARVEGMWPVPLVAPGLGLNVTAHGCDGTLHHAVMSTPAVVPEAARLAALLEEEHAALAALAG
jgi:diacylglycerol O-acyltransferase